MLAASIHEHAGLGNQIWRYVSCRVFAEHKGYEWGVSHPGWRGPFLNMDWGKEVGLNVEQDEDFSPNEDFDHYYKEEWIHHAVFRVESAANILEERQPAAEYLRRIVGWYVAGLIKCGNAAPVTCKVTKIDYKVLPSLGLRRNCAKCNHGFVETWREERR